MSWSSGENIIVDVSGLAIGVYNFTIVFYDQSDNFAYDIVLVTVIDTTAPTISSPEDVTYSEGETCNSIKWNVNDLSNGTWSISGDLTDSGLWTGQDTITFKVDGLTVGTYSVTITMTDLSGNSVSDDVSITVEAVETSDDDNTTTDTSNNNIGIAFLVGFYLLLVILVGTVIYRRR